MTSDLKSWGWDAKWDALKKKHSQPGQEVARVAAVYRDKWLLRFEDSDVLAEITGRFRHDAHESADYPAVGDWVLAEHAGDNLPIIHHILPRRTLLSRKKSGSRTEEQVLAANVDVVFITTAFDRDFSARRIERYAVIARKAGMDPVVLLNKCDLAEPEDTCLEEAREANPNGEVHRVSAKTGEGIEAVRFYLEGGKTGIFLGSSGVGKSSILNALFRKDIQSVQEVRLKDSRGRHTTTTRQMFQLPEGGLVIDTPGLRELQLWADESMLEEVFTDVATLVRNCQYTDCRHESEPGCAIKTALEDGSLSEERYGGYLKLQKELAYLKRKLDPRQRANTKLRWKSIHKQMKAHIKQKRQIPD